MDKTEDEKHLKMEVSMGALYSDYRGSEVWMIPFSNSSSAKAICRENASLTMANTSHKCILKQNLPGPLLNHMGNFPL